MRAMKSSVGLVADDMMMLHRLRNIMTTINCDVKHSFTAEQLLEAPPIDAELWLVVSIDAADVFDVLSEWSDSPIFLADDMPSVVDDFAYQQWRQRLETKLSKTISEVAIESGKQQAPAVLTAAEKAKDIWVIAASLGGPEAVKEFLSHIDADLPIAFIYAQHIEESFAQYLPDVLNKESPFTAHYGENGALLKRGTVTVFPSHRLTHVDEHCALHVADTISWKAPYTPNLDQVIQNVAKNFRENMGVIVFSGMCDDGALASQQISKYGVPIWAQQPEDCICSSMPDAVIEKDCVSYIGTARSLAMHLNQRYMAF